MIRLGAIIIYLIVFNFDKYIISLLLIRCDNQE